MNEFKLIVAGGRDFNQPDYMDRTLFALADGPYKDKAVSIVCGGARGADQLGYEFAQKMMVKVYLMEADWDRYGKRAGFMRNEDMGRFADGLVAFWDNKSKGTKHMIDFMQAMGKPVHIMSY